MLRRRRTPPGRGPAARALGGVVGALLLAVTLAPGAGGAPAGGRRGLTLVSQSPWVTPGNAFSVSVAVGTALPPTGGVEVKLTLYDHFTARSTFESTLSGTPAGGELDVAGPTAPTAVSGHTVTLSLPVLAETATAPGPSLDLHCPTGSCSGVYPLTVSVTAAGGRALGRLLTYLTVDEVDLTSAAAAAGPEALRVAWVAPFGAPVGIGPGGADPAAALPAPSRATVAALGTYADELAGSPVPVTVVVDGRTVQALAARGGAAGRAVVGTVAAMSTATGDEFPVTSYVPVDAGALAGAGLTGEVQLEAGRAGSILAGLHVRAHGGTWVAAGPVGTDLGRALVPLAEGQGVPPGSMQLVLPDTALAPTSDALTFSQPFTLDLGGTPVRAAASDSELAVHFAAAARDPALAANQLLADLAFIHYERPSVDYARGVVMVPPRGWTPDPAFVTALLHGLARNPVLEPVTLSTFFATVPARTEATSGTRRLATGGPGPVLRRSVARAVATERLRISGFESAAARAGRITAAIDDTLLAAETSEFRPHGQALGVLTTERSLDAQLAHIALAAERTITLTARNEPIPITVLSSAPYTVRAVLTLSSDKFVFPAGSSRVMTLDRATNPVRIGAVARTSGDLPVDVTLTSPRFGLVIAHELLTVRSTASSFVGIALTVLALVVLLVWWARTWWRGRERRARRERRGAAP